MSNFTEVKKWMATAGQNVRVLPTVSVSKREFTLRAELMREEFEELLKGMGNLDVVEIADGIADLLVVTYGTSACFGIDADVMFTEAMRANWSKFDSQGKPLLRADGKIMKGPNYRSPDFLTALMAGY